MASSASTRAAAPWNFHVFLSFRGRDTHNTITDCIYRALVQAGIRTFKSDEDLRKGKDVYSDLFKIIEMSKVSVIIFSQNYADSRWCLDELVKIMECKTKDGQTVLPVFYDVSPSDVGKQMGIFGQGFSKVEERFKGVMDGSSVEKWRKALREVANLSGWDLHKLAKGNESKFIQGIVEQIFITLDHKYLKVATHPVGIDSKAEHLNALLKIDSKAVHTIGICGIGGIGKTTMAKAVYNLTFSKFDGSSFLHDVKETAKKPDGLVELQKQLLYDTLPGERVEISTVDRGLNVIKNKLCHKRVLLVLDDVDHSDQLVALVGERNWFGPGSRIIITTRNDDSLKVLQVDEMYRVPELCRDESLRLFCWHAFGQDHPKEDYNELSNDIVGYTGGLPLALEVVGRSLSNEASTAAWIYVLEKLKKTPHGDILAKLRISFDQLNDGGQKNVFLDIACFFIGMDQDYVLKILDGCGFSSKAAIHVLTERHLLTIDKDKKLKMCDLLRDMAREVIRQESPNNPGERSRLWFHEDVKKVLTKHSGTGKVEGIILDSLMVKEDLQFSAEAFGKMHKLRLLHLDSVDFIGDYEHLFGQLRWLCWQRFPLEFIPTSFHLENLVALEMCYSGLTQIWKETKVIDKLKVLNLSHSHCLIETPDFTGLPILEKLLLEDCTSLVEVHPSIGNLRKLVVLNLRGCKSLRNLPTSVYKLTSLETLSFSGCSNLLPFNSVGNRLVPTSFLRLCSLKVLCLRDCNLSDGALPTDMESLPSLEILDLQENNFCRLTHSISSLSRLRTLLLGTCTRLQSLPDLPINLSSLVLDGCHSLVEIQGLDKLDFLDSLELAHCNRLAHRLRETGFFQELSERCISGYCLPGTNIPDWCNVKGLGSSINFELPHGGGIIKGLTLYVLFSDNRGFTGVSSYVNVVVTNKTKGRKWDVEIPVTRQDHLSVGYIPHSSLDYQLEGGDQLEVSVHEMTDDDGDTSSAKCEVHEMTDDDSDINSAKSEDDSLVVKRCGIRWSYERGVEVPHSNDHKAVIQYTSPSYGHVAIEAVPSRDATDSSSSAPPVSLESIQRQKEVLETAVPWGWMA